MKLTSFVICAALTMASVPAFAQATRTWVANDGDDSGPCSPAQPCQTFAAAIAKTAAAGEIDCLGIGGFGPVTITKAITIDCSATFGAILGGSGNAVVINAPNTAVVRLRGLSLQGTNTATSGIRILGARAVLIDDCTVANFTVAGIDIASTEATSVVVTNTSIENNNNGVRAAPATTGRAIVTLDRVTLSHNTNGVSLTTTGTADIVAVLRDSVVTSNSFGVLTNANPAAINLTIDGTGLTNNVTGISATGSGSITRVTRSTIVGNGTGVSVAVGGAQVSSTGDNVLAGNTADGTFTGSFAPQ